MRWDGCPRAIGVSCGEHELRVLGMGFVGWMMFRSVAFSRASLTVCC